MEIRTEEIKYQKSELDTIVLRKRACFSNIFSCRMVYLFIYFIVNLPVLILYLSCLYLFGLCNGICPNYPIASHEMIILEYYCGHQIGEWAVTIAVWVRTATHSGS